MKCLKTYLGDKQQCTQVNYISSSKHLMGAATFRLVSFVIHVWILQLVWLVGRYFWFVDMLLVYKWKKFIILQEIVNDDLTICDKWLTKNRLQINTNKTIYMVFTQRNMPDNKSNIEIGGNLITWVQKAKYLVLIFNKKLNWSCR